MAAADTAATARGLMYAGIAAIAAIAVIAVITGRLACSQPRSGLLTGAAPPTAARYASVRRASADVASAAFGSEEAGAVVAESLDTLVRH